MAMEVKIRTCTPIWTGGIESGKCDRIHETSILGSLRWWMEVLVRGLGGQVNDPTAEKSEERSGLNPEKFNAKKYCELQDEVKRRKYLRDAGLCDVSQIFGATGWKRQFRLEIQNNEISDAKIKHTITADRTYKNYKGEEKPPTWYFRDSKPPNAPKNGTFTIKIQSLNPSFKPEIIGGLIQFIADWSALGARPQMGFGVIKIEGDRLPMQPLHEWLISTAGNEPDKQLPSLKNIFLAKIQSKDSSFDEKSTFNLKYDLRQLFRTNEDKPEAKSNKPILKKNKQKDEVAEERELRHFIMGAAPKNSDQDSNSENKEAAKVKISRPYKDDKGNTVMRVWGWIPETSDVYNDSWNQKNILAEIHKHLADNYQIQTWREMKSTDDAEAFLRSLLGLKEDRDAV